VTSQQIWVDLAYPAMENTLPKADGDAGMAKISKVRADKAKEL